MHLAKPYGGAGWAQGRAAYALAGLGWCVPAAPVTPLNGQAPPCLILVCRAGGRGAHHARAPPR